jgi:DNA-binding transcriptional MerR regulator
MPKLIPKPFYYPFYTATAAAKRAGIEPRTLKLLVDRKLVHVAEKRGQGNAQWFDTGEIAIARVLGDLVRLGMNTAELTGFADWLRSELDGEKAREAYRGKPIALKIAVRSAGFLDADLERAIQADNRLCVSLLEPRSDTELATRLIVFNLARIFELVRNDARKLVRESFKPSFVAAPVQREVITRMLETHNDDEIEAFFALASKCAANGDNWGIVLG